MKCFIFKTLAVCLMAMPMTATAQSADIYTSPRANSAVTAGFKFSIPLGGSPQARRESRHTKMGFAIDYRRAQSLYDFGPQRFGLQNERRIPLLDLSLRGNGDLSTQLYGQDMSALFTSDYARADESAKGEGESGSKKSPSGLTKGLLLGGVVVISASAVLVNELKDDTEDVAECVVNAIIGLSDCPPQ